MPRLYPLASAKTATKTQIHCAFPSSIFKNISATVYFHLWCMSPLRLVIDCVVLWTQYPIMPSLSWHVMAYQRMSFAMTHGMSWHVKVRMTLEENLTLWQILYITYLCPSKSGHTSSYFLPLANQCLSFYLVHLASCEANPKPWVCSRCMGYNSCYVIPTRGVGQHKHQGRPVQFWVQQNIVSNIYQ